MDTRDGKTNWFDGGGRGYARFRPEYPPELAAHLAGLCQRRTCAVDVGCGSGQLTALLADHFDQVIGLDPSSDQLDHAAAHPRVTYHRAGAEAMPVEDASADLITAAQAVHWFDLPAFYAEARRIAAPGAVIALISYGVMQLDDRALNDRFLHFYHTDIGPFWPPERRLVDEGYANIGFLFDELPAPVLFIRRDWDLAQLLGYVGTWSAIRRAQEAGQGAVLTVFADDMARLWGDASLRRPLSWPIAMRIGRTRAAPH